MQLNPRQRQILWATVQHYIDTTEPVGSKILAQTYRFDLSSASIRNAMNALEQAGLLFQPHTSAGRVPTDSGYRVYVDELLTPTEALTQEVRGVVLKQLGEEVHRSLEALLDKAARLLAVLTGCVALITAPVGNLASIRHLRLVPVGIGRALFILVKDNLQTFSLLVTLPEAATAEELERVNNFLNAHLVNRTLQDLTPDDPCLEELQQWEVFLQELVQLIREEALSPQVGQIFVSGLSEILRQPELSQPQRLHDLIGLLEQERAHLGALILRDGSKQRVSIRIGTENPLAPMHSYSLVSRTFACQGVTIGSVGVLGPTRLPYDRAIASVQATADHLSTTVFS
jgi:heat-inducible transcriptional repressor